MQDILEINRVLAENNTGCRVAPADAGYMILYADEAPWLTLERTQTPSQVLAIAVSRGGHSAPSCGQGGDETFMDKVKTGAAYTTGAYAAATVWGMVLNTAANLIGGSHRD
jgi:hypothetical protein